MPLLPDLDIGLVRRLGEPPSPRKPPGVGARPPGRRIISFPKEEKPVVTFNERGERVIQEPPEKPWFVEVPNLDRPGFTRHSFRTQDEATQFYLSQPLFVTPPPRSVEKEPLPGVKVFEQPELEKGGGGVLGKIAGGLGIAAGLPLSTVRGVLPERLGGTIPPDFRPGNLVIPGTNIPIPGEVEIALMFPGFAPATVPTRAALRAVLQTELAVTRARGVVRGARTFLPAEAGAVKLPTRTTAEELMMVVDQIRPTSPADVILLREPTPGLTRTQAISNQVKRLAGKLPGVEPIEADPIASGIIRERDRIVLSGQSHAAEAEARVRFGLNNFFKFDEQGGIPALEGIDPRLPTRPGLADVADNYALFKPRLTNEQRSIIEYMLAETEQLSELAQSLGIEIKTRSSIQPGGGYLHRGRALIEGAEDPVRVGGKPRALTGKAPGERPAVFDSQAQGFTKGAVYANPAEAFREQIESMTQRIANQYVINKAAQSGLGETWGMRLVSQAPELVRKVERLQSQIAGRLQTLRSRTIRARERGTVAQRAERFAQEAEVRKEAAKGRLIDRLLSESPDDVWAAAERELSVLEGEAARMQRRASSAGVRAMFSRDDLKATQDAVAQLRQEFQALKPLWDHAKDLAKRIPRDQVAIEGISSVPRTIAEALDLERVSGLSFPRAFGNAMNKELNTLGFLGEEGRKIRGLVGLSVGIKANLDNSAMLINGIIAMYADTPAALKAWNVSVRAFVDKNVLGEQLLLFDRRALAQGLPTINEWRSAGLRFIGEQTGQLYATTFPEKIMRLPLLRQSNRAFGNYGDVLRPNWAQDLVKDELAMGRTLAQLRESGDLARIADITNKMTGWTKGRTLGSVGDILFFAPRFLQARIELLTDAARGFLPGASLDRQIARTSMLRTVGWGTSLTVALNFALGNETDFRPIVNGKWNPNFMRVRFAERDWSVFGPYDSMLRVMMMVGSGVTETEEDNLFAAPVALRDAIRGFTSPPVGFAWDLIAGPKFTRPIVGQGLSWWERMVDMVAPIDAPDALAAGNQALQAARRGEAGKVAGEAVSLIGELHGAKISPMSLQDLRDMKAIEKYGRRYWDLKTDGQRRWVDETEAVKELETSFPDDLGSDRQRWANAMVEMRQTNADLEQRLADQITAKQTGKVLRKSIQEWKTARRLTSETLFGDLPNLSKREPGVEDVLAEAYWSVPLPEDLETGRFNFELRKLAQEGILLVADDLGVPRDYILGEGGDSYRRSRFTNPEVQRVVLEYEGFIQDLDKRGYWEAHKQIPILTEGSARLEQYEEYRTARFSGTLALDRWIQRQVPNAKQVGDLMQLLDKLTDAIQEKMRRDDPDLDVSLLKWGFVNKAVTPQGILSLPPGSQLRAVKGIGEDAAQSLADAGFKNIVYLAVAPPSAVARITGASQKQAEEWVAFAREVVRSRGR